MASQYPDELLVLKDAVRKFTEEFKTHPEFAGCAPGRVNLIGEHTDYNDGFVFPMEGRKKDKALACQKAEHEFANMPCGIMDQFISTMGEKGSALFVDCRQVITVRSLEAIPVPINDPEIAIIIANSKIKHELASSAYAERRDQCQRAAEKMGKSSLRNASEGDLEVLKDDPLLYKRAKHVVTENNRTQQAAQALKDGNLKKFGQLMTESHNSLRDDYEVSCKEIDALVAAAVECPDVLGSRITGGGFGGCTVTLAPTRQADEVIAFIKKKSNIKADFYITQPSDGAKILSIPTK
ncbi:Galactokinase [Blattella germanica]|nr:Galactokinase [Blattella germanica]